MDGDGFDDLLVGAFWFSGVGIQRGAAYLVRGGPTLPAGSLGDAGVRWFGEAPFDQAGTSVALAGDTDGDGLCDLVVGAPLNDTATTEAGAAWLIPATAALEGGPLGLGGLRLTGETSGAWAGYSVAGAGDVDADGLADVLVGASHMGDDDHPGAVYLVRGRLAWEAGSLAGADLFVMGEYSDQVGYAVAGAGDVDADGFDDVVIGSFRDTAWIGLGYIAVDRMTFFAFEAEETDDMAGNAVAGAGDVDADGYDDVIIGAWRNDAGALAAGSAYLLLGKAAPDGGSLSDADARYTGEVSGDYAGASVAGAGDVDADGFDDVLVGAYASDARDTGSGTAYLLRGGPEVASRSLSEADARFLGARMGDQAGSAVAGGSDLDADGFDDLLIGAGGYSGGFSQGAVYVVRGHGI